MPRILHVEFDIDIGTPIFSNASGYNVSLATHLVQFRGSVRPLTRFVDDWKSPFHPIPDVTKGKIATGVSFTKR